MVVVISTLDFVGYLLIKFVGDKRGTFITGLIGGLVSSTAVAAALSSFAKKNPSLIREYSAGIVGASAIMFLRVLLLVAIINLKLVKFFIFPTVIASVFGFIYALIQVKKETTNEKIDFHNPYELSNALKFGFLFGGVLYITKLASAYGGDFGIYIVSAISGLTDVDAITLSLSKLSSTGGLSVKVAVVAIFIAVTVNTLFKWILTYIGGGKEVFKETGKGFLLLLIGKFSGLFVYFILW